MKPLPTLSVANWFVDKAKSEGQEITLMKLQKLTYYAHGWCLRLFDQPLVDQHVQACQWGPCFPDICDAGEIYGSGPVTGEIPQPWEFLGREISPGDNRIPLLEKIWGIYGGYTACQLARGINREGGPWHITIQNNPGRRNTNIDDQLIRDSLPE
jgi:uncharacterized phage-associated protein